MKWLLIVPAIVLGALLALFVLVMLLRVGVRVLYSNQALQVWVQAGPARFRVFPLKKKQAGKSKKPKSRKKPDKSGRKAPDDRRERAPSAPDKQQPPSPAPGQESKPPSPDGGPGVDVQTVCAYVRFGLDAAGRVARGLRVDKLRLKADIAAGDAAKTALAYGGACAAVSNLLPLVESTLDVRKRDLSVNACFEKNKTEVEGEIIVTTMVGRMALIGLRILIEFGKLKKAVSKNEQPQ